ncbi:MAG: hypothetical protein ACOH2H_17595 [Cypionkella sp.]
MAQGVFRTILRDPALRMVAILMMLQGALVCSFGPYISVLAVRIFGLGDRGYAAMMVAATLVSVASALYAGIRADQTANRRQIALGAAGLVIGGAAVMTFAASPVCFILAQALLFPANTLFGQLFAQARLAAADYPQAMRDGIQSTIRALFALPFVVVLPLWSLALNHAVPILAIYPVALGLGAAMFLLIWRLWPSKAAMEGRDRPSGLTIRAALAELASPRLALRILALGAVSAGGTAYWAVMGLVLTPVGGNGGDAALYAGLVAGLEVPFMLALPLLPRWDRSRLILIGAVIYAIHLVGIPLLAGTPWLWLLLIPGAAGGALTLTLPIAYLQDQLAARPGTGAALMALMKVAGDGMAAGAFALGTGLSGYTLAAVLGAAVTLIGAAVLVIADR